MAKSRIDRIRSCFDETLQQPVADVYQHLQNLYRATPEHALECLLEEHLDSLRILLYLLEAGGQTTQTIGTLLGEAGPRLGGDARISEQAITGRLEDYFGASEEQYRAIFNASATYGVDNWDFTLWLKNLANEEGISGIYTEQYMGTAPAEGYFGNGSKALVALPRTIGVTVSYRF